MSSSRSSSTRSSTPSKLSPPLLRQALRLIHCLQKERGASSAYSVSSQFLSNMEAARQQSDVALLLFARKDPRLRIATTLGKIRAQLDENNAAAETDEEELLITKFHRILVLFNTLIGSVVHTYILQHVNNSTCRIQVNAAATSKNQIMKRSSSVESFVPCKVPPLPSRNPRNSSVGTFGDVKNPGWTPKPNESFKEEPATAIGQSPKSAARNGSRRKIISFDAKTMESFVRPDPATCLLNLLSCFVRLKESTGLERALLSGMLSIGAVHPRLLADLILEVENQSSLVEELREQTIAEASLLQLIREGVILPLQLQELQQQILQRFNLSGIQLPSTQSVWNIITVYMDRLHSLELLLIEELESALATSPSLSVEPPRLEDTPAILQSILRDLYWEDLPSELIKSKLLEYMGRNASSSNSIIDRNIPGPISRTETQSSFGNEVAQEKSEWDINLYEIQFQKRIGRGTAGTTYLALWSGQEVAVKVAAITEMGLEGWKTETASLQRLHHPNIIRLLGSIYNPSPLTYCLVLEYCNAGDLGAALLQPAPSNFFDRVSKDMANGLAFLHSRDVIHRDIKPANVLLHGNVIKGEFSAKVTDFGVATNQTFHGTNRTAETGTYRWMAPEVIRHESYTETADVYSFAVVLWQLITREDPFFDKSPIEAAGKVALELARPEFPRGTPVSVSTLIQCCWNEDPHRRLGFEDVLKQLSLVELSESERMWLQEPFGHPIYNIKEDPELAAGSNQIPLRLPLLEGILEANKPVKKGLRKFFSKK